MGWGNPSIDGLYSPSFSPFDPVNDQSYYLEIFNRGAEKLTYSLIPENDWIKLSSTEGTIELEEKVYVQINWEKAPKGVAEGEIILKGNGREFSIKVPIRNDLPEVSGFVENNGVVAIEAVHFEKKYEPAGLNWIVIPNLGRTHSAVAIQPMDAERQTPGAHTPHLEYEFTLFNEAELQVHTYLSPTLNYQKNEGLKYAIAINDETPQIINLHEGETQPDWEYPEWWNNSVTDHIKIKSSQHPRLKAGTHTLKVWMVDPGVVFQKFVLDAGGVKESYLGPVESVRVD